MSSGFVAPQYPAPHPDAPAADTLPMPTSFVAVDGDDTSAPVTATKKARKNPWADLTAEQRAERLAAMKRGRAARKMSTDSLNSGSADAVVAVTEPAPAPAPVDAVADTASDSSSTKKERKPRAPLTDEQRTARRIKLQATLAAKKAANLAVANGSV